MTTKLVLEITNHTGDGRVIYRPLDSFPVTVGRGFHNDIIITDPHVSAQHMRIDFDGEKFQITDLGSENGVSVNEQHYKAGGGALKSGDTLQAGRTMIRVFEPSHPVPPAQRLMRANPVLLWLSRPATVWISFLMVLAAVVTQAYFETWEIDAAGTVTSIGLSVAAVIMIWSALWGVAGKLVRHKSRFRSHVALFSLFGIAMTVCTMVLSYVEFLSTSKTLSGVLSFAVNAGLCLMLLYGSLTLATELSRRKRGLWAGLFGAGAIIVALGLAALDSDQFAGQPQYSGGLKPYLSQLASFENVDGFMKSNEELFASKTFKQPPGSPQK